MRVFVCHLLSCVIGSNTLTHTHAVRVPTQTLTLTDKQAETGLAWTAVAAAATLKWASHPSAAPVSLLTREEVVHFASSVGGTAPAAVYTLTYSVITQLSCNSAVWSER